MRSYTVIKVQRETKLHQFRGKEELYPRNRGRPFTRKVCLQESEHCLPRRTQIVSQVTDILMFQLHELAQVGRAKQTCRSLNYYRAQAIAASLKTNPSSSPKSVKVNFTKILRPNQTQISTLFLSHLNIFSKRNNQVPTNHIWMLLLSNDMSMQWIGKELK